MNPHSQFTLKETLLKIRLADTHILIIKVINLEHGCVLMMI